jgi:hypothetical protein
VCFEAFLLAGVFKLDAELSVSADADEFGCEAKDLEFVNVV